MSASIVLALRLAMAVCLYAFLGWGLYTLWRDLTERGSILAGHKPLLITLTTQTDAHESVRRSFAQDQITIGRDPACEICLNDEAVSARHARLRFHHRQWWAEDLNSTNGTQLNQAALHLPTVLASGDQLECGNSSIIVSLGAGNEPSPTVQLN
ncbi:MAG: hypothetical protein HFACDABA_00297 [Anaerolineales bacterium]|nr:hypothetical protein [Anaerolineales bacterium]